MGEEWTLFNGCFHSYHNVCLKETTSCPLCKDFLQQKAQELGEIVRHAILHPASDMPERDDNSETSTPTCPSSMESEIVDVRGMEREEFENMIGKLNEEISRLNTPPQPHFSFNANQGLTHNTNASTPRAPPHCTK